MTTMKVWLGFANFLAVALMVLFFCCLTSGEVYSYTGEQVTALQSLRANWSSTPNLGVNLKGWRGDQGQPIHPCFTDTENWRGVECLRVSNTDLNDSATDPTFHILVVGLTLSNVNITGQLPPPIGNLSALVSLVLTENRELSGSIPKELANLNYSLNTLDLHGNSFSGEIFPEISRLTHLKTLDLSYNKLTGPLPKLESLHTLHTLSLSNNQLEGYIPPETWRYYTQNLTYLANLDLSHNKFYGSIWLDDVNGANSSLRFLNLSWNHFTVRPEVRIDKYASQDLEVLDLSHNGFGGPAQMTVTAVWQVFQSKLREIYLDHNDLNGTLDLDWSTGFAKGDTSLNLISLTNNKITNVKYSKRFYNDYMRGTLRFEIRLAGNPFCNQKKHKQGVQCFCYQACSFSGMSSRAFVLKVSLSASLSSTLLVILVAAFFFRRSKRQHNQLLRLVHQKFEEHDVKPTIFTYNELRSATSDFHPDMKLGEGAYGAVFKGVLPSKSEVAVKQLHINSQQGMDEFLNEVVLISGMKHRNLVKLKGCCIREKQRLLVYEYVDNHDLQWFLSEGKTDQPLSWLKRMNISLGIAYGLHYLHALAQPRIIHRDIKPANILMDSNFEPKIADFGLALPFPEETTHIMTLHVAGTKGYLAPECATVGQLSEKADVFSFGVVCLEVVSGRKCLDSMVPPEEAILTAWAQQLHSQGRLMAMVDPQLELSSVETPEVQRVLYTALLCLHPREDRRPVLAAGRVDERGAELVGSRRPLREPPSPRRHGLQPSGGVAAGAPGDDRQQARRGAQVRALALQGPGIALVPKFEKEREHSNPSGLIKSLIRYLTRGNYCTVLPRN